MEIIIIILLIVIIIGLPSDKKDNSHLNSKIDIIMATLQQLSQQVDELQAALDAEQQQIADAIGQLNATVAELQAIVADGGTAEERQALADKLTAITEDLKSTIPDAPVEPEEPTEPEVI